MVDMTDGRGRRSWSSFVVKQAIVASRLRSSVVNGDRSTDAMHLRFRVSVRGAVIVAAGRCAGWWRVRARAAARLPRRWAPAPAAILLPPPQAEQTRSAFKQTARAAHRRALRMAPSRLHAWEHHRKPSACMCWHSGGWWALSDEWGLGRAAGICCQKIRRCIGQYVNIIGHIMSEDDKYHRRGLCASPRLSAAPHLSARSAYHRGINASARDGGVMKSMAAASAALAASA